ncbi:helix-turn-helix domain-containing protein [Myxococcota bacterium]|nr:helix-turn-helix domain-containing protein [Myxococcota bacterium]
MARKHNTKNSPELVTKPDSLGTVLKAAREKMNLSVEEIHNRTMIPVASIVLLEDNQWEALPAPVYVRGFLKLYAREANLDYNAIIGLYPIGQAKVPSLAKNSSIPLLSSLNVGGAKDENKDERESRVSTGLVVFILLILATLAISYFASQKANSSSSSPSASEMANFDVTG